MASHFLLPGCRPPVPLAALWRPGGEEEGPEKLKLRWEGLQRRRGQDSLQGSEQPRFPYIRAPMTTCSEVTPRSLPFCIPLSRDWAALWGQLWKLRVAGTSLLSCCLPEVLDKPFLTPLAIPPPTPECDISHELSSHYTSSGRRVILERLRKPVSLEALSETACLAGFSLLPRFPHL